MDEAEIVFLKRACFFSKPHSVCVGKQKGAGKWKSYFHFSVEILQHPSKNIYSVLAFINILLKKQREKTVARQREGGISSTENLIAENNKSLAVRVVQFS